MSWPIDKVIFWLTTLIPLVPGAEIEAHRQLEDWHIDVTLGAMRVTVEYSSELGLFGISDNRAFSESCEEVYGFASELLRRVPELLCGALLRHGNVSYQAYQIAQNALASCPQDSAHFGEYEAIVAAYHQRCTA